MKSEICLLLALCFTSALFAAEPTPSLVLVQRAEKIVAPLKFENAAKSARVRDLVAQQYAALAAVHAARDAQIKTAKSATGATKESIAAATAAARTAAEAAQDKLHAAFLAQLTRELTPDEIEVIKNGMTYGVLPNTYRVYQQMLPTLTAEQKAQILAWLTEAREHALTAGTADEKHAWFGKYKGKINNFLSRAGYNMKEAEKNLKK